MISGKRAQILVMSFLTAAMGLFSTGLVQAQSISQPPIVSAVDANGVNLADGTFQLPGLDVGVGSSSSGIARVTQGTSDNFSGVIINEGIPVTFNGSVATEAYLYMNVSLAGTTHRFLVGHYLNGSSTTPFAQGPYIETGGTALLSCSGAYTAVETNVGTCKLILSDGTSAVYDKTKTSGTAYGPVQSITKPDGEVVTLTYNMSGSNATSLLSVNSSLGWMLKFQNGGVYTVNSAVNYCDPAAASCSVPSSYPNATLSVSGATSTILRNGTPVLSYTVSGAVTTLTSPMGVTKTITTSSNKVSSVVVGGSTWNYAYAPDGTGNTITTVAAPDGSSHALAVSYDHKIIWQTDAFNRKTSYAYDANGHVTKALNPDGNGLTGGFTLYKYDSYGRLLETDVVPKGGATNGTPNAGAAIVTTATYAVACDTTNLTNLKWCTKPTTTTDANGVVTTYTYDPNTGNVATVTLPAALVNSVSVVAQTRYTYLPQTPYVLNSGSTLVAQPSVYRLTTTSSCMSSSWNGSACANGTADERRNTIVYGSSNILPTTSTTALGNGTLSQTVTTTYNSNGQPLVTQGVKQTAADETYYFYDALGRQMGSVGIDPDGTGPRHRHGTHTAYDGDGHTQEIDTGIVGSGTTAAYSGADPVTRNGQAYSEWYQSLLTAPTQAQERNLNEFDSYGRPIIAAHYIANAATPKDVTQRSYDNMQRVSCESVRLNSSDYANDFSSLKSIGACTLGTTGSDGSHDRITNYSYDAASQITKTISAYNTGSTRTDALKVFDTGSATSTGTLSYVEDANGNRTSYYYDSFNRLIKTCYPLPSAVHSSSTTDCAQTIYRTTNLPGATQASTLANYISLRDGNNNFYSYDVLGRVSQISGAEGQGFTYDNFSDVLTHATSTSGTTGTETYVYNALGWLQSDAQPQGTVSYVYDGYGRRYQLTYPGSFNITYGYDNADEVVSLNENGSVSLIGFGYDDYGRRNTLSRANGVTTSYGYDSNLRLGTLTQGSSGASFYNQVTYGYNAADQIASKVATNSAYTYLPSAKSVGYGIDSLNRIASVNGTNFSYDGRGNLAGDGSGSIYTYNVDNLLTSAQLSGVTTTLTYDPENRLVKTSQQGGATSQFLYDGTDLIAEFDGSNNLLRRFVHGPGDDEPLVWYEGAGTGTKYYLGADDNGTVNVITNTSGGQYAINTYDEYGLPSSGNVGRFQYTGQTWLPEIKMYYFKARLYSPVIGRFMQPDPIGYGDGMNWYNYVHADPINGSDPSGLAQPCQSGQNCPPPAEDIQTIEVKGARLDFEKTNEAFNKFNDMVAGWELDAQDEAKRWLSSAASEFGGCLEDMGCLPEIAGPEKIEVGAAKTVKKGLAFVAKKACGCFVEGTEVETLQGLIAIQDIKVGELVLAYDEQTGRLVSEPVTGLIRPDPKPTFTLVFKGNHSERDSFRATADHPWFTANHKWVHTSDLKVGDKIETATGDDLTLVLVKLSGKIEQTYNLEVQGLHTFLVGKNHVVVHNINPACEIGEKASEKFAVSLAKRIEKALGKDARNDFHDAKIPGSGDRTKDQLIEDARDLFVERGLPIPSWLEK